MKALVTGAPGWLGTRLVEILCSRRREVRCLSLPSLDAEPIRSLGAEVIYADLTKPSALGGICDGIKTVSTARE